MKVELDKQRELSQRIQRGKEKGLEIGMEKMMNN